MAGGLMQLVAYGAQDVYLTGQPKVTFFQAVYKRHTNFAMENIIQTVNGSVANGNRVSVTIARNGDLIGNMYVSMAPQTTGIAQTSTNIVADYNWIAERAIQDLELTIGGQRIDKHYQAWWRLYAELFLTEPDKDQWAKNCTPSNIAIGGGSSTDIRVNLPLLFFFNRNPGLYLPLIALQYHEVRLDFNLSPLYDTFFQKTFEVWGNYVYLDTEERRRFAQKGHEYLIEQIQHTGADTITSSTLTSTTGTVNALVRLSYNHPVKELIWCYTNPSYPGTSASPYNYNSLWNFSSNCANVNVTSNLNLFNLTNNFVQPHIAGTPHIYTGFIASGTSAVNNVYSSNCLWSEDGVSSYTNTLAGYAATGYLGIEVGPLAQFKLILNGQDRMAAQPGKYYNVTQPFYYHTGNPYPGIYVYSFALQPEEHQPTGTCNFSRIDNAQVSVTLKQGCSNTQQRMFAVNYNVLRIQSGMGKGFGHAIACC
jgi:Large eukaryotic DNA virus major capsid protein/Major capsid protein N-terminus